VPDSSTSNGTKRREWASGILYGSLTIFALILLYVVVQTYTLLSAVRETQKVSRSAVVAIEDCTTPGKDCFEESQERTGNVVSDNNEVSLYAAYCADQPGATTVKAIKSCVIEQLDAAASPNE
jgi:hypothetical protein